MSVETPDNNHSLKVGLSFGLTSGVITTLGLMVGIYSSTKSELAVIGGILTIAIADSMSDALGIHVAEESENIHTPLEIWISTLTTFFAKFLVSCTFLIPVFLLTLERAIEISIFWGIALLSVYNYYIAKKQKVNPLLVVGEHVFIAILVIVITHFLGQWINQHFS